MKKILFMALGIISLMVACSPTRGLVRNPKIANTNSPEITITSIEFDSGGEVQGIQIDKLEKAR